MSQLRGYRVHDGAPEEMAILVFATTARAARTMGWPTFQEYDAENFTDMRAEWMRKADPKAWDVTEPQVIEPLGCERCCQWSSEAPLTGPLCEDCRESVNA